MISQGSKTSARDFFKGGPFATDDIITLYRGSAKALGESLGMNDQAVYRSLQTMESMGCIRRLVQGRNSPSTYQLIGSPSLEAYQAMRDRSLVTGQVELPTKYQRMQDAINKYLAELDKLRDEVDKFKLIERNRDDRIKNLEIRLLAMEEMFNEKGSEIRNSE